MQYVSAVQAALKAAAPVVAIPVDGHAPICIRAKLLKGALKGVTIHSVQILDNRWLQVDGMAGTVRTRSKFAPMDRYIAMKIVGEWAIRERQKAIAIINQGVLSRQEQRAMKLRKAEQAGIAELRQAEQTVARICAEVKAHVYPVLKPINEEARTELLQEYARFHQNRQTRKRGAVIRWKLKALREQCDSLTTVTRSRKTRQVITTLRRQDDSIKYAALLYQIGELQKQYKTIYPPMKVEWKYNGGTFYWNDSWQTRRPKHQAYNAWNDSPYQSYNRSSLVNELLIALADRRALTPPDDVEEVAA